jgi:hypothetical protein
MGGGGNTYEKRDVPTNTLREGKVHRTVTRSPAPLRLENQNSRTTRVVKVGGLGANVCFELLKNKSITFSFTYTQPGRRQRNFNL